MEEKHSLRLKKKKGDSKGGLAEFTKLARYIEKMGRGGGSYFKKQPFPKARKDETCTVHL